MKDKQFEVHPLELRAAHSEIQQTNGVHPLKGILAMGKTIYSFKPPFSSTSSMEPGFETAGRKRKRAREPAHG
ncbi:hypothetical protein CDAR_29791 [Caerostris darwini]|uniref:Uncharacterized protein n=1 Tax=Caerostris darwini TaxID=1538125 RepID=A0AAV4QRI7_9ARAC|nr:hypothetical protein CDAR_29791 [Caerostris darwini]